MLVVLIQVNYKFEYYLFYVEYISNLGRTASERKSKSSRHDKPHVAISLLINDILLEIQKNPCSYYYRNELDRVNAKTYNLMVKNAMFLPTMFKKNEKYGYKNRRDLLNDFQLMIDNSVIYNEANGTKPEHEVTKSAKKMISYAEEMITSKHDRWNKFENQLLTGKIDTEDINDDKSSVFSASKIYIGELLKEIQNLKNENNHLKGELGKIMTRYNLK